MSGTIMITEINGIFIRLTAAFNMAYTDARGCTAMTDSIRDRRDAEVLRSFVMLMDNDFSGEVMDKELGRLSVIGRNNGRVEKERDNR